MQRVEAQPGFVLHARPYRETSLLFEAFTRDHGRVGLIARGVRGARGQPLRALLQPLQPLLLDWSGRGELMLLRTAEAAGAALLPQGEGLLATFYINELLMRLLIRGESQPQLFWRYTQCLSALQLNHEHGWELRRFERDLLAGIGYALALEHEAESDRALDPQAEYRYDPERGAQRLPGRGLGSVGGAALLALTQDRKPDATQLRELRGLMRRVLLHHLGGRELHSWDVLDELSAQLRRPGPEH